jgi:geranylgeranylglycerol-phosphate geranylgeranyltransferase
MLAYGIQPYNHDLIKNIILTILALYSGFFAALIWNDITDSDIDAIAHPNRPLPSGKIDRKNFFQIALIFSVFTFVFALAISIWCFILVGIASLFVFSHNKYFKRRIRFPAYSEIFNPLQWVVVVIFGFCALWTSLPQSTELVMVAPLLGTISVSYLGLFQMIILLLFTYFADTAHDIAEGVHDADADLRYGVRTYATTLGKKKAMLISFIMFGFSGLFMIVLFLMSILSPVFLVLFVALFAYTYFSAIISKQSKAENIEEYGVFVGRKFYDYFLITYDIIFIDIIIQIIVL